MYKFDKIADLYKMSIQDPTLQAIASYYMSPAEAFIGLMVLFLNLFLEIVEKGIPKGGIHKPCGRNFGHF